MSRHQVLGYRGTQVLDYVRQTIARDGMAPSYAMIRDTFGLSSNSDVRRVVVKLEKRGLIRRVGAGRVRRIRLVLAH